MGITTKIVATLLFLVVPPLSSALAFDEEIIGEWNDNVGAFWKHNIKIVKQGEKFFRVSTFQDGSTNRAQLIAQLIKVKAKPNEKRRFKDLKSSFGEMYVIDANGNLDLYDKDVFIREAKKSSPESTPKSTAHEIRKATTGSCPAATLYAKSRVNIRSGPGLNENIVSKASRGEALRCDYSQGEWYRLVTHRTKEEWVHSSVVSTSNPVHLPAKKQESCYELGVRYSHCAMSRIVGSRCNPADDIVKPRRCMGDPSFNRGTETGASQVLDR